MNWKLNMYYYYIVKIFIILYWFNGEQNIIIFLYNILKWTEYQVFNYINYFLFTLNLEQPSPCDYEDVKCIGRALV